MQNVNFTRTRDGALLVVYSDALEGILRKYKGKVYASNQNVYIGDNADTFLKEVNFFQTMMSFGGDNLLKE